MKNLFIVRIENHQYGRSRVVVADDPTMFEFDESDGRLTWDDEPVTQVLAMGPTLQHEDLEPQWLEPPANADEFVKFILHNTTPGLQDGVTMQIKALRDRISRP